jgi:hypothetical protein
MKTHESFKKEFSDLFKIITTGKIHGLNGAGSDKIDKNKSQLDNNQKVIKVYFQTNSN